jgi:hypothetical protein
MVYFIGFFVNVIPFFLGYSLTFQVAYLIIFCFIFQERRKKDTKSNAQLYKMYEDDLEDLWRDY